MRKFSADEFFAPFAILLGIILIPLVLYGLYLGVQIFIFLC